MTPAPTKASVVMIVRKETMMLDKLDKAEKLKSFECSSWDIE
jgi:hypothetical protein